MESDFTYDHILVRYGELSTKGKNRNTFINRLYMNVKNMLSDFPSLTYQKTYDRLFIMLHGEDHDAVCAKLGMVFGISSFSSAIKIESTLEAMEETALKIAQSSSAGTFKMEARRHDKSFPMKSDGINRACATVILKNTDLKVDVKNPELRIKIEVRGDYTYVMADKIPGLGGYPVGINGKALVMLSGGIDSPVACYEMMKRGIWIECVHYASPPYTSQRALEKVETLASKIAAYQGHVRLHIVPFTDMQLAIYKHCDESYCITIMRRMMYRIAERLCENQGCLAIVNGESLGQVASQTLESMNTIGSVVHMPIIRPLVCFDKLEIIDVANRIGTYETSILPYEDCCTIFTPKNPVTKPTIKKAEKNEARFEFEPLLEDAMSKIETKTIYHESASSADEEYF